jgi:hypothetical protein
VVSLSSGRVKDVDGPNPANFQDSARQAVGGEELVEALITCDGQLVPLEVVRGAELV